jgi:hypothetical protein
MLPQMLKTANIRIRNSIVFPIRSRRSFTVLAFIIICIVLALIWDDSSLENDIVQVVQRQPYFDEIMARTGQNYPICSRISALGLEIVTDELNLASEEKKYKNLILDGGLNCGNVRVGIGLFSKRYVALITDRKPVNSEKSGAFIGDFIKRQSISLFYFGTDMLSFQIDPTVGTTFLGRNAFLT